jgi:hypothetical protein
MAQKVNSCARPRVIRRGHRLQSMGHWPMITPNILPADLAHLAEETDTVWARTVGRTAWDQTGQ